MNRNNFVRDRDEIEGALLLPEAHLVDTNDEGQYKGSDNLPTAVVATTTTTTITTPPKATACTTIPRTAVALVPRRTACHDDNTVKQMLAQAERRGQIEAEVENEAVQRINTNVNAINYFESKRVEAANEIAQYKNQIEEQIVGGQIPSVPCELVDSSSITTKKTIEKQRQEENERRKQKTNQEEFDGTYGKGGYEIPDYEIAEYNFTTTDYETTEYKSVYDV